MSQLSREECIELGLSVPTSSLVEWASKQVGVATERQERLECRGVTTRYLKEIQILIETVEDLQADLGKEKASLPLQVAESQRIRELAYVYCQEAKQILKIEFGTCPEIQAKCRLGVRTGRLLANLCREMECVVAMLREHLPQVSWLGVDEALLSAGDALIGKLKKAQTKLVSTCKALPPTLSEQCCEKGKLYDLTRKLVRIGQLEFLHEPEQAAAFNYTPLGREYRIGSEVRARTA
jgi:hypothetical protein